MTTYEFNAKAVPGDTIIVHIVDDGVPVPPTPPPAAPVQALIVGHSWAARSARNLNGMTGKTMAKDLIHGGYSLRETWLDPEAMAQITAEMEKGTYTHAAVMDFATAVANKLGENTHTTYAGKFRDFFAGYGVEMVLILPWLYVNNSNLTQAAISAGELATSLALALQVAPVGEAFALSAALRPELLLTMSATDSHPSVYGRYLRDAVLYSTLTGNPPNDLLPLEGVSAADADFLQEVAYQAIQEWGGTPPPVDPPPATGEIEFEANFEKADYPEWQQDVGLMSNGSTNTHPKDPNQPAYLGVGSLRMKMLTGETGDGQFPPGATDRAWRKVFLTKGNKNGKLWRVAHDPGDHFFRVVDEAGNILGEWHGVDGLDETKFRPTDHPFVVDHDQWVTVEIGYTCTTDLAEQTGIKIALLRIETA